MGNMKFDGPDVTFELDGFDALAERVRSKKINCKINPSDLPRLYAVMDAELENNEELSAAFAEAQEAAFNNAVLAVWAERIKSFKDSFIPVFGDACKDAACRFGFSKDGSNTFKSAVDAFAANICDSTAQHRRSWTASASSWRETPASSSTATPQTCPSPASSTWPRESRRWPTSKL